jgi:hypothetical protein
MKGRERTGLEIIKKRSKIEYIEKKREKMEEEQGRRKD